MDQRREERTEIIRLLNNPESIQMLAPRRIGKTWLLHRIEEDLKGAGWTAIFIDVEGMRTQDEFLRELCTKLEAAGRIGARFKAHFGERLRNMVAGEWDGTLSGAVGKIDSKRFSATLVESLNDQDEDTVILIDEIALFVLTLLKTNADETRDFLYHLRKLCQLYPKVRWVFTGSIGLDAVARRYGLSGALLDLTIFRLKPLPPEGAKTLLDRLSADRKVPRPFHLGAAEFEHFARELGWLSPFDLKKLATEIRPSGALAAGDLPSATVADIDAAFEELLEPHFRGYFAAWEEHLEKNFDPGDSARMRLVLKACSESQGGETEATIQTRLAKAGADAAPDKLRDLFTYLAVDGFLMLEGPRWRFVSGLLRRYWQRYH